MYQHGGDIYSNQVKWDFSVNVNPYGMPEKVKKAITENISSYERYPDYQCRALKAALSERYDIPTPSLVIGNGAAELIYDLVRALYFMKGKSIKALIVAPAFSEYAKAVQAVGGVVDYYILERSMGFALDATASEQLCQRLQKENYDILFLASPSNPNGYRINDDLIYEIYRNCAENETFMCIDECFAELAGIQDTNWNEGWKFRSMYLFTLRAFTKSYAMAGIRLGYGICSNSQLVEHIDLVRQCWSVSAVAQVAGIAALQVENDYLEETVINIRKSRQILEKMLIKLNFNVYLGEANFLLFHSWCTDLKERLLKRGILIRDCSDYVGLGPGDYRIAVLTEEANQELIANLEEILQELED